MRWLLLAFWLVRFPSGVPSYPVASGAAPVMTEIWVVVTWQSTDAFWSISSFLELQLAWFARSLCLCVWVLLVECSMDLSGDPGMLLVRITWFDSGYMFCNSTWHLLDELHTVPMST